MVGLYHLFFPLIQGRDESEKDSGLEPISPGTCQRQLSVTKRGERVYLFVDFLHLLYIVHREYTCSAVQGLLKPPLKEASIFGLR